MSYQCYKCGVEFNAIPEIFKHLKIKHSLYENTEKLRCVVKNTICAKSFMNYNSLRQHLKVCVQNDRVTQVLNKLCFLYMTCEREMRRNNNKVVFICIT